MSRVEDLEQDRQIAGIKAILESSMQLDGSGRDQPEELAGLDDGEAARQTLTGFGDGFEPPRAAWRARLRAGRTPIGVFVVVAVLTAAATALVTWLLRPAGTAVSAAPATIASADERGDTSTTGAHGAAATSAASPSNAPAVVVVAVVGSVSSPGLVSLPDGARVSDAIEAAGGPLPGTDLSTINIARKVADGEQIVVGLPGPPADSGSGSSAPQGESGGSGSAATKIDLNSASLEELDSLPGIGPVLAQRIVDFREENGPFKTVDELQNVSGVGPAVLAKIKDQVTV